MYDGHDGPYAQRCSVRRFFIRSRSRGNDGIPGYRQQPDGRMYGSLRRGRSTGFEQVIRII